MSMGYSEVVYKRGIYENATLFIYSNLCEKQYYYINFMSVEN